MDLRKAFDVINNDILLSKLDKAGITGTSYNWFKSYLTDRKQFVTYKENQSEVMDLNYGVPQGSVLGPSLFSIHFDGVSSSIKLSNCTLYADDTELHASDCIAASAAASVNCDLVNIDKWLSSNHMVPNLDKSLVMKIGSIPALKSSEAIDVRLRNQRLKEVTSAKYPLEFMSIAPYRGTITSPNYVPR